MKHPVPKNKTPKWRLRTRQTAFRRLTRKKLTDVTNLVSCSNCGAKRLSHFACQNCGMYRGRQVINFASPVVSKKVQKIKV